MPAFKINFTFMVTPVAPNTVVTCSFYFKASSLYLWFETHISQFHYHSVCGCRVFGDKLASVANCQWSKQSQGVLWGSTICTLFDLAAASSLQQPLDTNRGIEQTANRDWQRADCVGLCDWGVTHPGALAAQLHLLLGVMVALSEFIIPFPEV